MNDQLSSILDATEAEKLAGDFGFTEGPLWHPDGFFYFVDIRASRLFKIIPGQAPEVVREDTGEGNGTTFDLQGRLLICEGGRRRVTRMDAGGALEVVADNFEGKRSTGPTTSSAAPTAASISPIPPGVSPSPRETCPRPSTGSPPAAS